MMMMRWSFAVLAAVSLVPVAGCPGKAKPDGAAAIAKLEDIRNQMCKCTDKACTDKVNEEYAKWGQDQAKASGDKPAPSADDTKKTAAVMEEITKCTAKAIGGPGAAPAGAPAANDKPAEPPAGDKPADPGAAGSGSAAAPAK